MKDHIVGRLTSKLDDKVASMVAKEEKNYFFYTWLTCCCTMHMVANRVAGMVANMVADKEVDQVADKVAGHGCWLIGPKLFRPKPYLTCVSTKPCEFIQRIFCSGVRWHH